MVSISTYPKMVKLLGAGEKVEISNFIDLFCLKKTQFFFFFLGGTKLETRSQFFPKLSMALQCQNTKLLCQFFNQAIYQLAKTNLWNLKFRPSCLLQEVSAFLGRLNWKPRFRFCWGFSQPFTIWTEDCCAKFFPQAISLLDETKWRNLKFWPSRLL